MEIEKNRIIYSNIKNFLSKHFSDNYDESKEYEDCFHISVYSKEKEESIVWFEFDIGRSELIVGYGISHIHYGEQYGKEILEGLNYLLDFFTAKLEIIDFYKGKVNFKSVYQIQKKNESYKILDTRSMLFLYPFWKKTAEIVTKQPELIKDKSIIIELEQLKKQINKFFRKK